MPQSYQQRRRPHLELRHRTYLAVLEVPRSLRPRLGRRFVRSLETDSLAVAERRAAPILASWRKRIAHASGDTSTVDDAAFYRRALRDAKTDTEREAVKEVIWAAAYDVGIVNADDGQDPMDVPEAGEFYGRATATPFDDLLAEWQSTSRVIRKTKDMQAADVKRFTVKFPTVEDVTKPEVKRWADGLLVGGLAPKTVQRILWSLRSYWRHLQSVSVAPSELAPFTGLNVAKAGGRVSSEDERKAFPAADVGKLRKAAAARKDQDLADLIGMAMFTGARIEELCSLAVENVKLGAEVPHVTIIAGKTDAALRDVPIHADLLPVLRRLIGERTKGFVLADLTANKYDDRSNAIGKRFKTLARGLDFGPAYVFHSIRKTVAGLFKDAMVPEFVAAEILGHELATMSYGLYGRGAVSLATKREAVGKLAYPA